YQTSKQAIKIDKERQIVINDILAQQVLSTIQILFLMAELILSGGDITVSSYRDIVLGGPSVHGNTWILDLVVGNVGLMAEEHSCKLVAREVVVPYTVEDIPAYSHSYFLPISDVLPPK
ncbi:hypothetical protein CBL_20275, partial [Carabus blaptoides fortunei]